MLREEFEHLKIGDIVCRHYTFRDEYGTLIQGRESYIVASGDEEGQESFLVREYPVAKNCLSDFNKSLKIHKFHFKELELNGTTVCFDLERSFLYRELAVVDYGKNYRNKSKKDKNQRRILRIKPLNVRDLFIEFKGTNRKQGVIPYCKLPKEIIVLDMDPAVFDRAYIRRDGWLAWYLPNLGEYALSPDILYDLL